MEAYRNADASRLKRIVCRSAGWRPLSWLYARTLDHIDRWSWRRTGGRTMVSAWLSGLPVLLLTTRGARTGKERTSPLLGIPDGDGLLVIGSNYGRAHSPAWVFNLRANPTARIRFEGGEEEVLAIELTGPERNRAYARGVEVYPPWTAYQRRAAPRTIPVFRLHRASGRAATD